MPGPGGTVLLDPTLQGLPLGSSYSSMGWVGGRPVEGSAIAQATDIKDSSQGGGSRDGQREKQWR